MIKDTVIQTISKIKTIPGPVTEASNLYTDLGFDSLSFITLLTEIEETYAITFSISEIEDCLQVCQLIRLIETKI